MNGTKIFGAVLAAVLVVLMITSIASAQQNAGILHDQWFKVTLSARGYEIAADNETVLGRVSGSGHTYLYMSYDPNLLQYTVKTCMQDDANKNIWHKNTSAPISIDDIYGLTYPEVWDFDGTDIQIFDGVTNVYIYPILYLRITTVGGTLKNATISSVTCTFYSGELGTGLSGMGSCTLNGALISAAKVATVVPAACLAP